MSKYIYEGNIQTEGIIANTETSRSASKVFATDGTIVDCVSNLDYMVSITYVELKTLRDGGTLTPGMQYRITDYQCTTSTENTQSAGHQFDIIVTADSESVLNENARAMKHEGDTYFTNCNLSAWKLNYCLDNDTSRFDWADSTNGKGVIFYMKDEFENECAYDFKNIMYKLQKLTSITWTSTAPADVQSNYEDEFVGHYVGSWFTVNNWGDVTLSDTDVKYFYTFNKGESDAVEVSDGSIPNSDNLDNICSRNVIPEYIEWDGENRYLLNWIIFKPFSNEDDCFANVFGKDCHNNLFDYSFTVYNSFGNYCSLNTFGNECYNNTFGNECCSNTFGNDCSSNTFGYAYNSNTFGNDCCSNTFRDYCNSNTFGNHCYFNTFGNYCHNNTLGESCSSNTFGDNCYSNTFGNECCSNTFGNDCYDIKFGDANNVKSYYRYIRIESGNKFIYLNCTATISSSQQYQNVIIGAGVNNTNTYKTITDTNVGQTIETKFVPNNSQTIFV